MKRFPFNLSDDHYEEFYRFFPDHGQRTRILRKCVQLVIAKARQKKQGELIEDSKVDEVIKGEELP